MEKDEKKQQEKKKGKQVASENNPEAPSSVEEHGKMSTKGDDSNLVSPGYSFLPTDDELIVFFLKRKILNRPLPISSIRTANIYNYSPQHLTEICPSGLEAAWYFFTSRYPQHEHSKGNNPNRAAGNGFWKPKRGRTVIYYEGQKVGFKKAFTFFKANARHGGVQTKWRMNEYRLHHDRVPSSAPSDMKFDDWVLCKIYATAKVESNLPQDNTQNNEGMMATVTNDGLPTAVQSDQDNPQNNEGMTATVTNEEIPTAVQSDQDDDDTLLAIVVELLSFLQLLDEVFRNNNLQMESEAKSDDQVQEKKGKRQSRKKK